MNKEIEREKLLSYLGDLKQYSVAIINGIHLIEDSVINGNLNDEACSIIRKILSGKTAKTNLSEVNLAFLYVMSIPSKQQENDDRHS